MSRLPPPERDHYPGLHGAQPVGTDAMKRTKQLVREAIEEREMALVYGDVGLGKTFAVRIVLRKEAAEATVLLDPPPNASKSEFQTALWTCLELDGDPSDAKHPHQRILDALGGEFRVLLVDEVQLLSTYALEYLRHLWEHAAQRPAVIFIGSGNTRQRVLHARPVHSRIHDWQQFTPLTLPEVLNSIPVYHPVWKDRDPGLIEFGDDIGGHGNFRNWAHATFFIAKELRENPDHVFDKDLIRWAFSRIDPTDPFRGR